MGLGAAREIAAAQAHVMKTQPLNHTWTTEEVRQCMSLIADEVTPKVRERNKIKKKLLKNEKNILQEFDPADPDTRQRLCMASLKMHRYHWDGWERRNSWASDIIMKPWVYPRWDGKKRRVLVLAEQGLGDEILWASCYDELSEDVEEAWIEADPRIIPTFERSFPDNLHFISRFLNDEKRVLPKMLDYPEKTEAYPIECFIPSGNVPPLYRRMPGDFAGSAYLVPDGNLTDMWRNWLDSLPGLEAAISWRGRQGEIEPPHGNFLSVQYGGGDSPYPEPPIDLKWDVESVLSLLKAVGKVITVPNTVAHMAGALGIDADVILPPAIHPKEEAGFNNRVQWQWPNDHSDWYHSMRIFRNLNEWLTSR